MTIAVVDMFEVVGVEKEDGKRPVVSRDVREGSPDEFVEVSAVGAAGQTIDHHLRG